MFVRTLRLTLRPGWAEDAPELAQAIGHWEVCSRLAQVPWPYAQGDALAFLNRPAEIRHPMFFVFAHESDQGNSVPRMIGGVGIHQDEQGEAELGYWLTPNAWGRGYATEAARAVVDTARETLRIKRLVSGHFVDNPASGNVLRKLGFRPTGRIVPRESRARGHAAPCATFELDLGAAAGDCDDPRTRMAA